MQQQQQASNNQLTQVLAAALSPKQPEVPAAQSEEMRQMREELARLREKEHDAKLEALKQQIQDTKIETLKAAQPKESGTEKILTHLMSAQQVAANENTKLMLKMMDMSAEKPTQSDQIASILSSMIGATSTNIELMSKAAQAGLLGGTDSPIKDALVRSMESVIETLPGVLQSLTAGQPALAGHQLPAQAYAEVDDEEEEMTVMPAPDTDTQRMSAQQPAALPEGEPEAGAMGGVHATSITPPPPDLPSQPPSPAVDQPRQPTEEEKAEIYRRMLTDEEIAALLKDQAMTTILAKIQNGVSPREISARIWAHAVSPNKIAAKWLSDPEIITQQVVMMTQIGDMQRIIAIAQDMIAFREYVSTEGADPNRWPDTDYRPVKSKKPAETVENTETTPPPEQGEATTETPAVEDLNEGVSVSEIPDPPPVV
jgi:hypothetical protein